MLLTKVNAKKIKDSRGDLTIEVSLNSQKSSAPQGASTSSFATSLYKKSLDEDIKFLNKTKFDLEVNDFKDLKKIESKVKKNLGANSLFALEAVILKVLAKEKKKEVWQLINSRAKKLPIPVGNAIGGGKHSHTKTHPTFQEFLLIPNKKSFKENVKTLHKIHTKLKSLLKTRNKNDEGAWNTSLNNEEVLEILDKFKKQTRLGLDIAANSFCKKSCYHYKNRHLDKNTQIHYINSLIKHHNLFYTEDPLIESDFSGFSKIKHSSKNLVVGDDLTATHLSRLKKAVKNKSLNATIIKPNQNGSLIELKKITDFCKANKIKTIFSHRSGETLDPILADLAFGFQADFIKTGIATKWREAKLNRLIEIERSLK